MQVGRAEAYRIPPLWKFMFATLACRDDDDRCFELRTRHDPLRSQIKPIAVRCEPRIEITYECLRQGLAPCSRRREPLLRIVHDSPEPPRTASATCLVLNVMPHLAR